MKYLCAPSMQFERNIVVRLLFLVHEFHLNFLKSRLCVKVSGANNSAEYMLKEMVTD